MENQIRRYGVHKKVKAPLWRLMQIGNSSAKRGKPKNENKLLGTQEISCATVTPYAAPKRTEQLHKWILSFRWVVLRNNSSFNFRIIVLLVASIHIYYRPISVFAPRSTIILHFYISRALIDLYLTCPINLNRFSLNLSLIDATSRFLGMHSFLIISFCIPRFSHRNLLVSASFVFARNDRWTKTIWIRALPYNHHCHFSSRCLVEEHVFFFQILKDQRVSNMYRASNTCNRVTII